MNEIDLGAVRVVLTAVPTGAGSAATEVEIQDLTSEFDALAEGFNKPAFVPAGLTFAECSVVRAPVRMMVATYHDPKSRRGVTIAQTPIASLKASEVKASVFAPGEDLEEVRLDGKMAARVIISSKSDWRGARHSLVWVSGDNVYQLNGRGTTDSELVEIAASV